jgi:Holliday junction resolvase RusA-like endonuclease
MSFDYIENPISFNSDLIGKKFISFNVYGEPFAKQRPRAAKKGRYITVYTPKETKLYEAKVRSAYYDIYPNNSDIFNSSLTINIEGIFSIPKSTNKKNREAMLSGNIHHTKKPDCDNMAKVCLDALNEVAYRDDALIDRLNISKRYGKDAMVRITIIENGD